MVRFANLCKAVKIAKDLNPGEIPRDLTLGGVPVAAGDVEASFAKYFKDKICFNKMSLIDPLKIETHANPSNFKVSECLFFTDRIKQGSRFDVILLCEE